MNVQGSGFKVQGLSEELNIEDCILNIVGFLSFLTAFIKLQGQKLK